MVNQEMFQTWIANGLNFLPKLIAALIIFVLSIWGAKFAAKGVRKLSEKRIESEEINKLIYRITRWTLMVVGTIIALDQVDFDITGFIAGLGVAGFTIGFALQDMAKNFISGLMLLYRQPFKIGEWVEVSEYSGTVKEINVRDTVIQAVSGETIIIPNKDVFENPIINYSHTPLRRSSITIGLGYGEDCEKAISIFIEAMKAVPGVERDPKPLIRAQELGESTLQLAALFWINQEEANILDVHSEVVKAVKLAAQENGIDLPYPIQTVRLEREN